MKNIFYKFIALFFTALVLLLGFYFRFLIERLPHAIKDSNNSYYKYVLIVIIIILFISIYLQLKLLSKKKKKPMNFFGIKQITLCYYEWKRLLSFLLANLYTFCCYLFSKTITYHYLILIKLGKYFIKLNKNPGLCIKLILGFEIFPRILLNFALFLDIFIFQYFFYSYKCIFILLLPLLLHMFFYMMKRLFFDFFSLTHNILLTKEDGEFTAYYYTPQYEKNPPWFVQNIEDFIDNHYFVLIKIFPTIDYYNTIKNNNLHYQILSLFFTMFRLFTSIYLLYNLIYL